MAAGAAWREGLGFGAGVGAAGEEVGVADAGSGGCGGGLCQTLYCCCRCGHWNEMPLILQPVYVYDYIPVLKVVVVIAPAALLGL